MFLHSEFCIIKLHRLISKDPEMEPLLLAASRSASDLSCSSSSTASDHPDHADSRAPTSTFACVPRVAVAGSEDYFFAGPPVCRGSSSGSCSSPRQCGVRFGNVDVLRFETQIDDSKLPSDGLALGLGELLGREHLELERYEALRRGSRRRGVWIIPPDERRASLSVLHLGSVESLVQIEALNAQLRQERALSQREYISQIAYERIPPGEAPPAEEGEPPRRRRKLNDLSLVRVILRSGAENGDVVAT